MMQKRARITGMMVIQQSPSPVQFYRRDRCCFCGVKHRQPRNVTIVGDDGAAWIGVTNAKCWQHVSGWEPIEGIELRVIDA